MAGGGARLRFRRCAWFSAAIWLCAPALAELLVPHASPVAVTSTHEFRFPINNRTEQDIAVHLWVWRARWQPAYTGGRALLSVTRGGPSIAWVGDEGCLQFCSRPGSCAAGSGGLPVGVWSRVRLHVRSDGALRAHINGVVATQLPALPRQGSSTAFAQLRLGGGNAAAVLVAGLRVVFGPSGGETDAADAPPCTVPPWLVPSHAEHRENTQVLFLAGVQQALAGEQQRAHVAFVLSIVFAVGAVGPDELLAYGALAHSHQRGFAAGTDAHRGQQIAAAYLLAAAEGAVASKDVRADRERVLLSVEEEQAGGAFLGHKGEDDEVHALLLDKSSKGDAKAMIKLAHLHGTGRGGHDKNTTHAVSLFTEAASLGSATGMYNLGLAFYHGLGGKPRDTAQAEELFARAASLDFGPALNGIAMMQFQRGDEEEALRLFEVAAEQGMGDAATNAAMAHLRGRHGAREVNITRAVELFSLAAAKSHPRSMLELGRLHVDLDSPLHTRRGKAEPLPSWSRGLDLLHRVAHSSARWNRFHTQGLKAYLKRDGPAVAGRAVKAAPWRLIEVGPLTFASHVAQAVMQHQPLLEHVVPLANYEVAATLGCSDAAGNAAFLCRKAAQSAGPGPLRDFLLQHAQTRYEQLALSPRASGEARRIIGEMHMERFEGGGNGNNNTAEAVAAAAAGAFASFAEAAGRGDKDATFKLAYLFQRGVGVDRDLERAKALYRTLQNAGGTASVAATLALAGLALCELFPCTADWAPDRTKEAP